MQPKNPTGMHFQNQNNKSYTGICLGRENRPNSTYFDFQSCGPPNWPGTNWPLWPHVEIINAFKGQQSSLHILNISSYLFPIFRIFYSNPYSLPFLLPNYVPPSKKIYLLYKYLTVSLPNTEAPFLRGVSSIRLKDEII